MPAVELLPRDWSQLRRTLVTGAGLAVFAVLVLVSHGGAIGLLIVLGVVIATTALLRGLQAVQWARRGNPPSVLAALDPSAGRLEIRDEALVWRPRSGAVISTDWSDIGKLGIAPVTAAAGI